MPAHTSPEYLIQARTGVVFVHTPALAKRADMRAYDPSAPASTIETRSRVERIVAAIAECEPAEYTASGVPAVEALERRLGLDISAAERDRAWERHQQGQR